MQDEYDFSLSRKNPYAECLKQATSGQASWLRVHGSLRGKVRLDPGWDSPDLDKEIEAHFEALHPDSEA